MARCSSDINIRVKMDLMWENVAKEYWGLLWNKSRRRKKKTQLLGKMSPIMPLFVLRLVSVCLCMRARVRAVQRIPMLDTGGEAEASWGKEHNDSESSSRCTHNYWTRLYNGIHNRKDNLGFVHSHASPQYGAAFASGSFSCISSFLNVWAEALVLSKGPWNWYKGILC